MMKKNILFLTTQLPFPPHSGGIIKSYRTALHLSQKHHVDIACLLKDNNEIYLEQIKHEIPYQEIFYAKADIPRTAKNIIIANCKLKPISFYRNYSKELQKKLDNVWQKYDVIFVDHVDMFQYIPKQYFLKTIIHQHNAEFKMWKRAASVEKNPIKKLILQIQATLLQRLEIQYCNETKAILASPNDELELKNNGVQNNNFHTTYHLGDDSLIDEPALHFDKNNFQLLYIGTLTWEANIDGLLWFFDEVWDKLKAQIPQITFNIIGKNPDKRIEEKVKNIKEVKLLGFVDDVEQYFKQSKCFIVPLRFGSGIKVKVISAMYRGIPCVTTSIGTEGLKAENKKHIFIADDATIFVEDIITLMNDEQVWNTLAIESRKIAIEEYSWSSVFEIIDNLIATY